ncbi:ABC transporter permease [Nocardioides nanhaiensis]|uniref:FtsX-like permease family protein n=1 Tax=Nocardioides nanhaiensis TaxID=1476871 RepID=A0ABP8WBT6_9ACTN
MRTVLLASLRHHGRRYVAAGLAVVIGVTFVVVTAGISSSARHGIEQEVSAPFAGADVVLTGLGGSDVAPLLTAAEQAGAEAAVQGVALASTSRGGRVLAEETLIGFLPDAGPLRQEELLEGAWPQGPGEAVAEADAAAAVGVEPGDELVLTPSGSRQTLQVRVVGLVESAGYGQLYLPQRDLAPFVDSLGVDLVTWAGPTDPITRVAPGATVVPAEEYVAQLVVQANDGVDVLAILLLVFATIALFVSVLVIANTFAVLLAQRQREVALLRCVGATRRQVVRALRTEALALGVTAATVGLLAGTLLAHAITALVARLFPDVGLGRVSIAPAWYAGAFVVGLLVTLVAAWFPTLRSARVAPVAALRTEPAPGLGTRAGRGRVLLGVLMLIVGTALLGLAVLAQSVPAMLGGGTVFFTGVLVLGPVVVPAVVRWCGRALGVAGVPGRLATDNAVRNPRRTAATTASLLVGVTLTTAVLTGMATARSALLTELDRQHPVDALVVSGGDALDDADLARVRAVDGVTAAEPVRGVQVRVRGGGALPALAPDEAALSLARDRAVLTPAAGEVLVPWSLGVTPGSRVRVTGPGGAVTLRVVTGDGFGEAAVVAPATLTRLAGGAGAQVLAVWGSTADDVDGTALATDLADVAEAGGATSLAGIEGRAWVELQLDVVTGSVVGLLGIAVVIALLGIANTLGLSVLERARENALLRALGLTRRQLRATLAAEAVLLSVAATLIGTLIGTAFAWVGVQVMVTLAVEQTPMVLPWGQLAGVVAVAGLAGLLAGVLPARRAARTAPAAGLAVE